MKKFLGLIIFIGIAIAGWMLYVDYTEKKKAEVKQEAVSPLPQITSTGGITNQPVTPHPSYSQPGSPSKRAEIFAVARDTRVTIISYQEAGNQATVVAEAPEHINLGDFLDELVKRGIIRDLDADRRDFKLFYDKQLQRHYRAKYLLKW